VFSHISWEISNARCRARHAAPFRGSSVPSCVWWIASHSAARLNLYNGRCASSIWPACARGKLPATRQAAKPKQPLNKFLNTECMLCRVSDATHARRPDLTGLHKPLNIQIKTLDALCRRPSFVLSGGRAGCTRVDFPLQGDAIKISHPNSSDVCVALTRTASTVGTCRCKCWCVSSTSDAAYCCAAIHGCSCKRSFPWL
jgi:hypothetical protein